MTTTDDREPSVKRKKERKKSFAGARLTGDVDGSGEGHVGLADGAEQGAVVDQPSDAVVHHDLPQVLVVQNVRVDERA